jgi:hypothetical protein
MKKILLCIIIAHVFVACKPKQKEVSSEVEMPKITNQDTVSSDQKIDANKLPDTEKAKQWLVKSIESYFVSDLTLMDSVMNSICTKTYFTYKSDATGVDMDGGMTKKGFEKKWKNKFNTQFGGSGVGFLISGQDWTKIKVSKCVLSNKKADEGYLFETIITDKGVADYNYKREIKVIKSGDNFLIADVLEYE